MDLCAMCYLGDDGRLSTNETAWGHLNSGPARYVSSELRWSVEYKCDGLGALEQWACSLCVIWMMTVGWVQMTYTKNWSWQQNSQLSSPCQRAGTARPFQLPSQYKSYIPLAPLSQLSWARCQSGAQQGPLYVPHPLLSPSFPPMYLYVLYKYVELVKWWWHRKLGLDDNCSCWSGIKIQHRRLLFSLSLDWLHPTLQQIDNSYFSSGSFLVSSFCGR